ncbi:MAG: TlpA family protein disulfide reductase [Burkholderiales bacterium]|nr:TlpA family protein disulfide reductase [Burkholderiales bacterium]
MKPLVKAGIAIAIVGGLAAAVVLGGAQSSQAPHVNYTSIRGQQTTQDALQGKVVLVNFWATSCSGCVEEMPKLIDTYGKYHAKGFETVAVAMSYDEPNYVSAFTEQKKLPFFVALDVDGNLAKQFGDVSMAPTSFLIDKHGRIVQRYLGTPDFDKLHTLIEQKLQEA